MRVTKLMSMVLPLALSMALAVGVQAKTKSGKSSTKGTQTTVTGCLQTGSSPNTFVLNSASSEEKSSKNMSGSTPSQMARSEASSYTLIPQKNVDLQKWVGQRVRVTGRMASSTSSSPSSSSESSSSMDSSSMGGSELMVTSIRKIGGACQ